MNRSYIINDVNGNPINEKYPPNKDIYGDEFGGYRSEAEKVLFHDFAVLSSDFYIFYNDTFYSVNKEADSIKVSWNAFLSDSKVVYNEEEYHDEMGFLENFKIDGKFLMNIIDNNESIKLLKRLLNPTLDMTIMVILIIVNINPTKKNTEFYLMGTRIRPKESFSMILEFRTMM